MRRAGMYLAIGMAMSLASGQEVSAGVAAVDAWRDIGKSEMVCGQVVDSSWSSAGPNAPTYLYLDRPRPEQVFTIVIPIARRELFGESPEKSFRGKRVCVTGKLEADAAANRARRARITVEAEEQMNLE